ncbi:hypothetical protein CBS147339_7059 [Penicillium roqueforti]|uniref:Genomic scaffold, ProqFM164S04 n=1 Tax=Penicillium roqueforti (strain FM164) TaxID=1365484 RepID=W6QLR0_PENRF|nr:hypothetical protein LCP963914a_322 [Penicillium roqueforti]CDM35154.1 unnamed protein product [Penicillium roqueforti FM164]KAI3071753.1 hypothetical protein CBS147339_7059 [Penicillium roqueforti]KAI3102550.1 hypothetical protein CBS147338_2644 [Penicillium roqueforti]KAI3138587.1 hypothetical protein CBS147325_6960 [Penicillium roqueforti]
MTTLLTPRGHQALAISIVFTTIATLIAAVRILTRAFLVKQMGADDYVILVSLAFSWVFFGLMVGEVYHGMGEHYRDIPAATFKTQMLYFWASVPIYQTSLISTKMSILLQYKRVFSTPHMRRACWLLIGFLGFYGAWTIISAWANCVPLAKFWDPTVPGFCLDKKALWFSNSAIHILTDTLILIYPMPVLKSLQLPKKQKFALIAVFALGGFVLITSILRLKSLLVIANSSDPTYDNVGAATWSAVECNVAIICASLPGTRAFLSKLLPHIFSTRSNGYRSRTTRHTRNGNPLTANGNTQVLASVVGGRGHSSDYDHDLEALSPSGSFNSYTKEPVKEVFAGIKVTTNVTQESTSHSKIVINDDMGSTKELVKKHSF